jgi:putative ABC transport system permease protein
MLRDNFNLAYKNIRERLSRSVLTLLGIAIGIMAIISLMAIGEGMNVAVTGELSSLSDTIIITVGEGLSFFSFGPGGGFDDNGEYLTDRDIAAIERIQGIKDVSTQLTGVAVLSFNGINISTTLSGMDISTLELQYEEEDLAGGTLLKDGDQNKIIIGYDVAHNFFDSEVPLGGRIKINGKKFFVTGIFSFVGAGGIISTDDVVLLTSRDFKKLTGESNIRSATVRVLNVNDVENIANEIEVVINENHGEDEFASATTMSSILESILNVIGILQLVLVAIASVALIVASIGIMNTMLTSVMERTREIGIMKAIGATNKDVMLIFIIEGVLVSLVGGIIGLSLGVVGSRGMTAFLGSFGGGPGMELEPVITVFSVVLAISVSMFVGVLSSLYPAWKAAKMSPIEAVRYE